MDRHAQVEVDKAVIDTCENQLLQSLVSAGQRQQQEMKSGIKK